jgi:hypothetical protein
MSKLSLMIRQGETAPGDRSKIKFFSQDLMMFPKGIPYQLYPDRTNLFPPIKLSLFWSRISEIWQCDIASNMNMRKYILLSYYRDTTWENVLGEEISWGVLESQTHFQAELDGVISIKA